MWNLAGKDIESRLFIGSALYPSPSIMRDAISASGADVVTVSLRRQSGQRRHEQPPANQFRAEQRLAV